MTRMPGRRPWVIAVAVLMVIGMGLAHGLRAWAHTDPIRKELLQPKAGRDYAASILRLSLRDPARDARDDLAAGDRGLYCVGTYGCGIPGVGGARPQGMPVHATASTGCVVYGGALGMVYRREEERYLAAYNAAKVAAARGASD